jgi:hypothetical protein
MGVLGDHGQYFRNAHEITLYFEGVSAVSAVAVAGTDAAVVVVGAAAVAVAESAPTGGGADADADADSFFFKFRNAQKKKCNTVEHACTRTNMSMHTDICNNIHACMMYTYIWTYQYMYGIDS